MFPILIQNSRSFKKATTSRNKTCPSQIFSLISINTYSQASDTGEKRAVRLLSPLPNKRRQLSSLCAVENQPSTWKPQQMFAKCFLKHFLPCFGRVTYITVHVTLGQTNEKAVRTSAYCTYFHRIRCFLDFPSHQRFY